LLYFITP
nr:immunoglobulin heavy chain junction region [Mus musculus]